MRARSRSGDEPFALLLPDMIMRAEKSCLKGMVELYEQTGDNVIAVEECDPAETGKYGIVQKPAKHPRAAGFEIVGMVEKPKPEDAPIQPSSSTAATFLQPPRIFDILATQERGRRQRNPADRRQIWGSSCARTQKLHGYRYEGRGPNGLRQSGARFSSRRTIAYALGRPDPRRQGDRGHAFKARLG